MLYKPKYNFVASVIIPNWNGKHLLKTCLSSLKNQTFSNFETIVVDNGSTDGSVEYIKRYFSKIKIVALDKNYGFAKAINIGINKSQGNYLILLNNDTEADKDSLNYLVKAAKKYPEVGFVATKMLNFYHRNIIDSAGDYIDEVGHANNIGLGEKDGPKFNKGGYLFLVTGGGSLLKRQVLEKVGLFDEHYFAYMEDVDLCLRAQLAGFKGWYEPKAKIFHIHKATSSKNHQLLEYLQFRNMTQTIIKDFPTSILLKKWRWLKIILVHFNTIFYQLKNGFFWPPLMTEIWLIIHLPRLLIERIKIQKTKRVSDEYIESNLYKKEITFWGLLR